MDHHREDAEDHRAVFPYSDSVSPEHGLCADAESIRVADVFRSKGMCRLEPVPEPGLLQSALSRPRPQEVAEFEVRAIARHEYCLDRDTVGTRRH